MSELTKKLFLRKYDSLIAYLEENHYDINDIDEHGWSALAYAIFWLKDTRAESILVSYGADLDESLARYLTLDSCRDEVISLYLNTTHIEYACEKLITNAQLTVEILSRIHQTYQLNLPAYSQMIADYAFKQLDKDLLIYLLEKNSHFDVHGSGINLIQNIFIDSDKLFREAIFYILEERDIETLYSYAVKNTDYLLFKFLLEHGVKLHPDDGLFDFIFKANKDLQTMILSNASEQFITDILCKTLELKNFTFLKLLFELQKHLECTNSDIVLSAFFESNENMRQKMLETNLLILDGSMVQKLVNEAFKRNDSNLFYWAMYSSVPFILPEMQYLEFNKLVRCTDEWVEQLIACQYIDKELLLISLLEVIPERGAINMISHLLDNGARFHRFTKQDKLQELFIVADYRAKLLNDIKDFHPILKHILDERDVNLLNELISLNIDIRPQFENLVQLSYDENHFELIEKMYNSDDIKIYAVQKLKEIITDLSGSKYKESLEAINVLTLEIEEKEVFLTENKDALENWISVGDEEDDKHFLNLTISIINQIRTELKDKKEKLKNSRSDLQSFEEKLSKYVQFVLFFSEYILQKYIDDFEKILESIGNNYVEAEFEIPPVIKEYENERDEIPF